MTFQRDVAEGIHRIEDAYTNWYLVDDGERLTIVNCGVPTSWKSLTDALMRLGRPPSDVAAIVVTHAHFDHIGFAERARSELRVPIYVHEDDFSLTRHPRRYGHERAGTAYFVSQPRALPIVAALTRRSRVVAAADRGRDPLRRRDAARARVAARRPHAGPHDRALRAAPARAGRRDRR